MWDSIKEIYKKIKYLYTNIPVEFLFSIIIILVGFSAFGLGRLSVLTESRESISLKYNNNLSTVPEIIIGGAVVVSKKGSRYHYPWCAGALRINKNNRKWYDSIEDARAAGYTPSKNCKGLK